MARLDLASYHLLWGVSSPGTVRTYGSGEPTPRRCRATIARPPNQTHFNQHGTSRKIVSCGCGKCMPCICRSYGRSVDGSMGLSIDEVVGCEVSGNARQLSCSEILCLVLVVDLVRAHVMEWNRELDQWERSEMCPIN